jgi:hypothetical protein
MSATIVQVLPDGEELVVEGRSRGRSAENPRERTLEMRQLVAERDAPRPQQSAS